MSDSSALTESHRCSLSCHAHREPGIRLVQQCIEVLGGVTYRSCEGHPPIGDSGLQLRHIGIVARDDRERVEFGRLLRRLATRANPGMGASSRVVVEVSESEFHSDSAPPCPAIDVVFTPQPGLATRDYFEDLAITYSEFCHRLGAYVADPAATHPVPGRTGTQSRTGEGMPAGTPCDSTNADLLSAVCRFYDMALSWHCNEPATSSAAGDIAAMALHLHAMNFGLWHHEDAVRLPGITNDEVARRKRAIDDLNARRSAAVEHIDFTLLDRIDSKQNAPLHTETPGTIVDRLSVLTLRILHTNRAEQPGARLAVLEEQYDDLFDGLEQFLTRLHDGEIRFKLYRQFKSTGQRSHCALFEAPETGGL